MEEACFHWVYERDGVGIKKKKKSYPKIMLRDARHVALCLARHPSPSPYYQLARFTTSEIVQLLSFSRSFPFPLPSFLRHPFPLFYKTVIPTAVVVTVKLVHRFVRYINPLFLYKSFYIPSDVSLII